LLLYLNSIQGLSRANIHTFRVNMNGMRCNMKSFWRSSGNYLPSVTLRVSNWRAAAISCEFYSRHIWRRRWAACVCVCGHAFACGAKIRHEGHTAREDHMSRPPDWRMDLAGAVERRAGTAQVYSAITCESMVTGCS